MYKIIFSNESVESIDEIYSHYVERFSPEAADELLSNFRKVIRRTMWYREFGKHYRGDIRYLVVRTNLIIFYTSIKKDLFIISISRVSKNYFLSL